MMGVKLLVGDIKDIYDFWRQGMCGKGVYSKGDGPTTMTHACNLPKGHTGECSMVEGKIVGKRYVFHCPGCGHGHSYEVRTDGKHPSWTFNGNLESPTFQPSLLMYGNGTKDMPRCHIFLTAGVVDFLGDCQHEYAGKKYPLPDVDGGGQ
jgi:hypothetical protein